MISMDEGDDKKLASCFVENGIMEIVKVRALRHLEDTWTVWSNHLKFPAEPWWKLKRNIQVAKKSELLPHLSKKNFHAHNTGKEMFASNSQMSKFHDLYKYYDHRQYDYLYDH